MNEQKIANPAPLGLLGFGMTAGAFISVAQVVNNEYGKTVMPLGDK